MSGVVGFAIGTAASAAVLVPGMVIGTTGADLVGISSIKHRISAAGVGATLSATILIRSLPPSSYTTGIQLAVIVWNTVVGGVTGTYSTVVDGVPRDQLPAQGSDLLSERVITKTARGVVASAIMGVATAVSGYSATGCLVGALSSYALCKLSVLHNS